MGANFDVMENETRLERRLDRLIEHAVNPRKAAVVIATVTTVITAQVTSPDLIAIETRHFGDA